MRPVMSPGSGHPSSGPSDRRQRKLGRNQYGSWTICESRWHLLTLKFVFVILCCFLLLRGEGLVSWAVLLVLVGFSVEA